MQYQILALGGDGIGPEVLDSGIQIIKHISEIKSYRTGRHMVGMLQGSYL